MRGLEPPADGKPPVYHARAPVQVWWRLFFPAHTRLLAWLLGGSCAGWACRGAAALAVAAESALPVWLVFEHRFSRLKQRLFLQTLEKRGARVAAAGAPDADALARALQERRRLRALSGGPASAKPGAARAPGGSSSISSTSAGGFGITSGLSLEVAAQLVKALLVPGPGEPKRIKLARCGREARTPRPVGLGAGGRRAASHMRAPRAAAPPAAASGTTASSRSPVPSAPKHTAAGCAWPRRSSCSHP